jgi:hypothetical protein
LSKIFKWGNDNSSTLFPIALIVMVGVGIIQIIGTTDDPRYMVEEPIQMPLRILSSIMISIMIFTLISRLVVENGKKKKEN